MAVLTGSVAGRERSTLVHGEAAEAYGIIASGAQTHVSGHVVQEIIWVEVTAESVNVGPVLP
jgi:hypothetical protein